MNTRKPYIKRHADGTLWAKGSMANGVMEGYWKWFRKDGTLMRSGHFSNGKQVGEWVTFDAKGKVYKRATMKAGKGAQLKAVSERKVCSRGHVFYKSSACPVCPVCWPGARKRAQSDFPEKLAAPALRALAHADIKTLKGLTKHTEKEIAALHGMGPNAVKLLKLALKDKKYKFAE